MQFPVTRQAMQDIAQLFLVGIVIFGALALVARSRGGSPRRYVQSIIALVAITAVTYALAFTVAPDIPTPPVPFTARFQSNPVTDTDENINKGRDLFQANCAICHGPLALGNGPAAFTLQPRPFNLQVHVPLHPTGEVFYWISNGVPGTGMPVWKDKLSDTERWTIIRYLDALASKRVDH